MTIKNKAMADSTDSLRGSFPGPSRLPGLFLTAATYGWFMVLAVGMTGTAHADCSVQPTHVEALGDKLGIFDKDGKFLEEAPGSVLDGGVSLLGCNEDLGLIEVKLANGESKWLDRGELRLTFPNSAAKTKVCIVAASSRAVDRTEAAVAGVDPDKTKECLPPEAVKPGAPAR